MGKDNQETLLVDKRSIDILVIMRGFDEAPTVDTLWNDFTAYAESLGADLMSYHHFSADYAPSVRNETYHIKGFPDKWVREYIDSNYSEFDPIIQKAKISCRPYRWLSLNQTPLLTGQQKSYMTKLQSWMKGDGYGVPVFGPSGQNGYFGIGSTTNIDSWDDLTPKHLHLACEGFHLRYCELRLLTME